MSITNRHCCRRSYFEDRWDLQEEGELSQEILSCITTVTLLASVLTKANPLPPTDRICSSSFDPLIQQVKKKLANWKLTKIPLIRWEVNATHGSSFLTPYLPLLAILDQLESNIFRSFLCGNHEGRGIHLIAWDHLTNTKAARGLGIKDLRLMREASPREASLLLDHGH